MYKEVKIDIGGGQRAEYFVGLASHDRSSLYVVLDPQKFRCLYVNIYPNLRLMRWGSGRTIDGNNWELPFQDATVDHAYLNNIYGVMDEVKLPYLVGKRTESQDDKEIYSRIVSSLRRVMKPSGVVHVKETQVLLGIVQQIYLESGFRITGGPKVTAEEEYTPTSFLLSKFVEEDVRKYGVSNPMESMYLPMELTAVLG